MIYDEFLGWIVAPHKWRTRWDLIGYVSPEPPPPPPCPGEGACHGCLKWCNHCGDVGDVCDVIEWPACCDAHQRYPEPPPLDSSQLWLPWTSPHGVVIHHQNV